MFSDSNNNNNHNKNKKSLATKLKLGLSVASINVGGITSEEDKRVQLSAWVNAHSTDIVCMQEYYKRHEHSKVEFNMANFRNYDLVLNNSNTKTLILIKSDIRHEKIVDLYCNIDGLDCICVAVFCCKYIIIIGSIVLIGSIIILISILFRNIWTLSKIDIRKRIKKLYFI